ncbi:MAG: NapC/NirT family cytochrome c [Deltaproteobacteria bacterium]|jgi:nitrate/TMAO reductase-like tetraheme cytochrome c subunit|nr:NapC/NirT family cytochrome c [Deltaproteobacteria bacterium]
MKNIFNWCKQHIVLFTIISVVFVVVFGFVNIQILHMTSEPEFCHLCHPAQGFGPLAEVDSWEHSAHGEAGVSCLDCHGRPGVVGYMKAKLGGLYDTYMQFTISKEEKLEILSNPHPDLVPSWHCLYCHSDQGNKSVRDTTKGPMKLVKMRMLDDVVNPDWRQRKGLPDIMEDTFVGGSHFNHTLHIEDFDLTCRDCHFGVVHNPSTKTDRMNFCLTCHADAPDDAPQMADCNVCHEAQLAMNQGTGVAGVEDTPSLMYGEAADMTCTDCHTGITKGVYRASSTTCADCHGDSEYQAVFDDWAAEAEARIDELKAVRIEVEAELLDADRAKRNTAEAWETYQRAITNLKFVRNDGTNSVHNNEYATAILDTVEADFKETLRQLDTIW